MNQSQRLWWQQAKSDHDIYVLLRGEGRAQCHILHYLQMTTEKLAKAYFWRSGSAPPKSHAGFVQLLRFLGSQIPSNDRDRVANLFGFGRFNEFQSWIYSALPIAYELERITPHLANDGPNPEYPWPHARPLAAPVHHDFEVWAALTSGQGRHLMRMIRAAVEHFPEYADV